MLCPKCRRTYDADAKLCAYDGTLLLSGLEEDAASDGPLRPGMRVGDYRIEALIGEGGMGEVYLAVQPLIDKRVAVKVLKSTRRESIARFIQEARAISRLQHPNIVDIFTFGQLPGGRHYFVMEYLEGVSLDTLLREQGALPVEEALAILRPAAVTLDAVHARGIAHRDLKPPNLFLALDEHGRPRRVKLLDFGIAKPLALQNEVSEATTELRTLPGQIMGTPHFMAPELFGSDSPIDHPRADLYALGVMAWYMLTGDLPFHGRGFGDLVARIMLGSLELPSKIQPALPEAVDSVLLRAISRPPAERFPSGQAFVEALEAALSSVTGAARTVAPVVRPRHPTPAPSNPILSQPTLDGQPCGETLPPMPFDLTPSEEAPGQRAPVALAPARFEPSIPASPADSSLAVARPPARGTVGLLAGGSVVVAAIVAGIYFASHPPVPADPSPSVSRPDPSRLEPAGTGRVIPPRPVVALESPAPARSPIPPAVATSPTTASVPAPLASKPPGSSPAPAPTSHGAEKAAPPVNSEAAAEKGRTVENRPAPTPEPAAVAAAPAGPQKVGRLEVGGRLPRIAGLTLDGSSAISHDMLLKEAGTRGLVVQFWASWCAPCKDELAQLDAARQRLSGAGVRVLLVNVLEEPEAVERWIEAHPIGDFPVIRDEQGVLVGKLGLATAGERPLTLPLSVVTDAGGTITAIFAEGGKRYVERILAAL